MLMDECIASRRKASRRGCWRGCSTQAAACWLIVADLTLTAARSVDADTPSCNARGDHFVQQQQWQKAVDAYRECSSRHGGKGPVAAWSMYKIYHVAYWQMEDKATAGAACEAGWEALQAPELAWCAGFVASYTKRPQEAVEWSKKAIAAGCFSGSCNSLATNHPDPWSHNGIAKLDICSWEGPYDVMYWACKSLQDEACTAEARRRVYQAKYARQSYAKNMDLYRQTKEDVSVQRGPALRDPGQCGKRMLKPRPVPAGHYEPQLHVVTFATDLDKHELDELLSSAKAHGVRVTILQPRFDLRGYWGGRFGLRLQLLTNFANLIPDEDIVMFVDGYDVIFTRNSSAIIDGYYKATKGRDVALFAAETAAWLEKDLAAAYPPGPTRYKFLNAGTWMGTAHAVRCAMSAIHLSFDDHGFLFTDDQWVFANAFLASSKTSHPIIALDYQADVFASLYDNTQGGFDSFVPKDWECVEGKGYTFKLTGTVPSLFHASGNQGQHWVQREVLPHSIRSGQLGKPAACGPQQAAHQQQGGGEKVAADAPTLSESAHGFEDSQQVQQRQRRLQQRRRQGEEAGWYTPLPRLTATRRDLRWQLLLAAVGLALFFATAAAKLVSRAAGKAFAQPNGCKPQAAAGGWAATPVGLHVA